MVTIVDPAGTSSIYYNRSGLTLVPVNAAGTTGAAATPFGMLSEYTVVLVTTSAGNTGVKMPSDADTNIGDVLEIHGYPATNTVIVYDADGNGLTSVGSGNVKTLRKLAANVWRAFSAF